VLANAMAFDADLDRSVTREEFAAGVTRLAAALVGPEGGDLSFDKLTAPVQPMGRPDFERPPRR
jgi:hypothetical protein